MLGGWWRRVRTARRARATLRRFLADPTHLVGTSLRPAHAGRADLVDWEEAEGELTSLTFTILRHPRPHPFSSQHHLVAEVWQVALPDGPPKRLRGLNLSKLQGDGDGRPTGGV